MSIFDRSETRCQARKSRKHCDSAMPRRSRFRSSEKRAFTRRGGGAGIEASEETVPSREEQQASEGE